VVLHATAPSVQHVLDEVAALCSRRNVRIALENLPCPGQPEFLSSLLENYPPDFVGVCYDSGHGNLLPGGLDWLRRHKSRVLSLHLNDNRGQKDDHQPPFEGTVPWNTVAEILARSSYQNCQGRQSHRNYESSEKTLCLECTMPRKRARSETEFLSRCFEGVRRLDGMVKSHRENRSAGEDGD
jgi:sugar phosphate isomerase/epimerase